MMKRFKVLVLTDHSGHSEHNSIYALLRSMVMHEQCESIHVASRGIDINDPFFNEMDVQQLFAAKIDASFSYSDEGHAFKQDLTKVDIQDFDLIFMRLPRPISDEFLLWIDDISSHAVIINKPKGIIETSSKAFLLNFPDSCPPIKLCHSIAEVMDFGSQFAIVLKPLREYGGKGLIRIDGERLDNGTEMVDTLTYLKTIESELTNSGYLAMKYLKNVSQGDKRILVVGGEIIASSLRLPAEGSWLCNVAQGGTSVASEVTEEEVAIIKSVTLALLDRGVVIFGADTLVDDDGKRILSEINTLSIGGFPQAEVQTGKPVINQTINKIFEYAIAKSE